MSIRVISVLYPPLFERFWWNPNDIDTSVSPIFWYCVFSLRTTSCQPIHTKTSGLNSKTNIRVEDLGVPPNVYKVCQNITWHIFVQGSANPHFGSGASSTVSMTSWEQRPSKTSGGMDGALSWHCIMMGSSTQESSFKHCLTDIGRKVIIKNMFGHIVFNSICLSWQPSKLSNIDPPHLDDTGPETVRWGLAYRRARSPANP